MGAARGIGSNSIKIRLPEPHPVQEIFLNWEELYPDAQVLVAPCGTKVGKSFGSSEWLLTQALVNPGFYCAWIAPTLNKARIGYRYMKAMLPDVDWIDCKDGRLEIYFGNNSFIKFLHGRDAEVTVEGEAIDAFVIDEAGKQSKQLWFSLFTTITQTLGKGIITGTPRGFTWFYDIFKKAKAGDPFFCCAQLSTEQSPYVTPRAIEQARRILPKGLFDQYYRGLFVSMSTVFGDLSGVWQDDLSKKPITAFWVHPDAKAKAVDLCVGVDWAKQRDRTVFFAVNAQGQTVGFWRFRGIPYTEQVKRLAKFCKLFTGDLSIRHDATGVGVAVSDLISEMDIDATITGVTFTNASKQDMVTRATIAVEQDWFKCPRIDPVVAEFSNYELSVTKTGLFSFSAPEGEHDDCVSAGILAISGAYASAMADSAQRVIESALDGTIQDDLGSIDDYASAAFGDALDSFNEDEDGDWLDGDNDDIDLEDA